MYYRKTIFKKKVVLISLSNCFRQFYLRQNNNEKLKKHARTSNNTKYYLIHIWIWQRLNKQKYWNPHNLEIMCYCPTNFNWVKLKGRENKTLWKYGKLKTWITQNLRRRKKAFIQESDLSDLSELLI